MYAEPTELEDDRPDVLEEVDGPVLGLDGHEEGLGPSEDGRVEVLDDVVGQGLVVLGIVLGIKLQLLNLHPVPKVAVDQLN